MKPKDREKEFPLRCGAVGFGGVSAAPRLRFDSPTRHSGLKNPAVATAAWVATAAGI